MDAGERQSGQRAPSQTPAAPVADPVLDELAGAIAPVADPVLDELDLTQAALAGHSGVTAPIASFDAPGRGGAPDTPSADRWFFDAAPNASFLVDGLGIVRLANRAAECELGEEVPELVGLPLVDFLSEASGRDFLDHLSDVLVGGRTARCDLQLRRRDGGGSWVRMTSVVAPLSPIMSEGIFASLVDIDDRQPASASSGAEGSASPGSAGADQSSSAAARCGRVLVVDDEQVILDATLRMLRSAGFEVEGCCHPDEALSRFEADPKGFDAVITDHRMPGMSGLDLSQRLLELRPEVPVVLVSGFTAEIDASRAHDLGVHEIVAKPLTARHLRATLAARSSL